MLLNRREVVVGEDVAGREEVASAEGVVGDVELDAGGHGAQHLERLGDDLGTDPVPGDDGEAHGARHAVQPRTRADGGSSPQPDPAQSNASSHHWYIGWVISSTPVTQLER